MRESVPHWSGASAEGYWQYSYDALDRPLERALYTAGGALDRRWLVEYRGHAVHESDPKLQPSTRTFSAWSEPLRIDTALGGHTQHSFDGFGRLKQISDAYANSALSVSYNARGMPTQVTDMAHGTRTYTPNALGEVIEERNTLNQASTALYDALGRLTSRTDPEGTSTFTWGNDAGAKNIGRLQAMAGPGYSESHLYDTYGRPIRRTIVADTTYQFEFSYDEQGLPATVKWPSSMAGVRYQVKYGYSHGYLSSVREFTGGVEGPVLWTQGAVDARGNAIDETYGNGVQVVTGFAPLTGQIDYRQSGIGGALGSLQDLAY